MSVPTVTVEEAFSKMQAGVPLVDVREEYERANASIPGTLHVAMSNFMEHYSLIPKDEPVMIYCASGNRSGQIAGWLNSNGYDASNVQGGIYAWAAAGLPVEP